MRTYQEDKVGIKWKDKNYHILGKGILEAWGSLSLGLILKKKKDLGIWGAARRPWEPGDGGLRTKRVSRHEKEIPDQNLCDDFA